MRRTPTIWITFALVYLSVQVTGILLGIFCIMLKEDPLVLPAVLFLALIIGIPVTAVPTALFSLVITALARGAMLVRPGIQLHALGVFIAIIIFFVSLFVIGEAPATHGDILALLPFALASVAASMAGTYTAKVSLRRYAKDLHNKAMQATPQ